MADFIEGLQAGTAFFYRRTNELISLFLLYGEYFPINDDGFREIVV
jgi:hypothetical protein